MGGVLSPSYKMCVCISDGRRCVLQVECPGDGAHSDGNSSTSDLLDILLQEHEDSHSGTDSATSGSMGSGSGSGSGSNGCGTSASGASGSRASGSRTGKLEKTFVWFSRVDK